MQSLVRLVQRWWEGLMLVMDPPSCPALRSALADLQHHERLPNLNLFR
ncbi:unnamed protein product [Musa hybrid cultivar]